MLFLTVGIIGMNVAFYEIAVSGRMVYQEREAKAVEEAKAGISKTLGGTAPSFSLDAITLAVRNATPRQRLRLRDAVNGWTDFAVPEPGIKWQDFLVQDETHHDLYYIKGTRCFAYHIVARITRAGMSVADVMIENPGVTEDSIVASLMYAQEQQEKELP